MMTVLNRHLGSDGWTGTVDLQVLFFRLTLDSATEFLFGESVNSQLDQQTDITNSGKDDDSFAYAFDRSQYILAIAARLGHNYWLMHTPEFHRMVERVHKFVDYFVQKAMSNRPGEKQASDHYVFLHALAEQTQDPAELRSQLLNILLAGRDTTASLLGWFFHTLADKRYEPIYKRLRQIVVDEFGTYDSPRDITFERMKSCQYLQWCINEALRLYPVVPMNVRTALTDTTLPTGGGDDGRSPIFVPKGTDVGYSVSSCHAAPCPLSSAYMNASLLVGLHHAPPQGPVGRRLRGVQAGALGIAQARLGLPPLQRRAPDLHRPAVCPHGNRLRPGPHAPAHRRPRRLGRGPRQARPHPDQLPGRRGQAPPPFRRVGRDTAGGGREAKETAREKKEKKANAPKHVSHGS